MPFLRRPLAATLLALLLGVLAALLACSPAGAGAGSQVLTDPVGVWPLQPTPEVVRGFAPPDTVWGPGHRGVDLLGTPGQAVHAAMAGTVRFAGSLAGRGVVVVDHGETRTTYEPVSATAAVGAAVAAGDVIGTLQAIGSHCPPRACLHWGWLRGDVYLDPLDLVGAGRVRLLPLWRDDPLGSVPETAWLPLLNPYAVLLALVEEGRQAPDPTAGRGGLDKLDHRCHQTPPPVEEVSTSSTTDVTRPHRRSRRSRQAQPPMSPDPTAGRGGLDKLDRRCHETPQLAR